MILLLQSVTAQCRRLFLTYFVLQSATRKFYYKVRQVVLQSVSGITKFYDYHKVRPNKKARSTLPNLYNCTSTQ